MAKKVKDIYHWLNINESEIIPHKDWKIQPNEILENYKNKKIDRLTALYLLKELYYTRDFSNYNSISFRSKCLNGIVDLSKKNNELKIFLEQAFITEYWYPMRLLALKHIAKYYKKLGFALFNYISEQHDDFLVYVLERNTYEHISFIESIIKDKLIKLFINLKKEHLFIKINIPKRKLFRGDYFLIQLHNFKEFKRMKQLSSFNEATILNQPIKYFVWKDRTPYNTIYDEDIQQHYPISILHTSESEEYITYYGMSRKSLENLIYSLNKLFELDNELVFRVVKTSLYYLISKIEKENLYIKIKLSEFQTIKID